MSTAHKRSLLTNKVVRYVFRPVNKFSHLAVVRHSDCACFVRNANESYNVRPKSISTKNAYKQ